MGFAIAAHLDAAILLVDEVLAVGDEAFKRRCLDKMRDATRSGRTVLFVSHNMASIRSLCSRSLLLEGGELRRIGPTDEVVQDYLAGTVPTTPSRRWTPNDLTGTKDRPPVVPRELTLVDKDGEPSRICTAAGGLGLRLDVAVHEPTRFAAQLTVHALDGTSLYTLRRELPEADGADQRLGPGVYRLLVQVEAPTLRTGSYFASLSLEHTQWGRYFHEEKAIEWTVTGDDQPEREPGEESKGYVEASARWRLTPEPPAQ